MTNVKTGQLQAYPNPTCSSTMVLSSCAS